MTTTGRVALIEEYMAYSDTEIFFPNILTCAAVAIRLQTGFIGLHLTPCVPMKLINEALTYMYYKVGQPSLQPPGNLAQEVVFFGNDDWESTDKTPAEGISRKEKKDFILASLKSYFQVTPREVKKLNTHGSDLWLHAPVPPSTSGMRVIRSDASTTYSQPSEDNSTVRKLYYRDVKDESTFKVGPLRMPPPLLLNSAAQDLTRWIDL
uniref:Uncharacterized protein n=1 Tax=Physcomitrium patens TaxID=3218 RepID=A0A2K1JQP6_PHYPA|nr:hypothetical protein PHYPA_016243 [Physcomitrium patens]